MHWTRMSMGLVGNTEQGPMEPQRQEKEFLTQILLTCFLEIPKQGRHVEV